MNTWNEPPPLPVARVVKDDMYDSFGEEFESIGEDKGVASVIDALLKHPARVVYEIVKGRSERICGILLGLLILCMMIYGFIMGMFSGKEQLWVVPIKVTAGLLLSGAICLPSLYIFMSLAGGNQSFAQASRLLLLALALNSVLLMGFAPVTWVFSQSTGTVVFMGSLHLAFLMVSMHFGLRLMKKSLAFLNERSMHVLKIWVIIFVMVLMQMTTVLRPLVGKYERLNLDDKKFFVGHWFDELGNL
jgi:hypothetical protein